jgi:predicted Fe-Mo cluster-binding NifX family protein
MLIAITAQENSLQSEIDPRFGRAAYYMIVNTETDEVTAHNNSDGINASNGAGTGAAQTLSEYGVKALYTGKVGPKAAEVLNQANIPYYENITGTVQGVLDQLKGGTVSQNTVEDNSVPVGGQTATNENSAVAPQCAGALPGSGQGQGMGKGRGQGMGRGMGSGRGTGGGQGRGGCRS